MNSVPALATGLATVATLLTGPAVTAAPEKEEFTFLYQSSRDSRSCSDRTHVEKKFPTRRFWCVVQHRSHLDVITYYNLMMAVVGEWLTAGMFGDEQQCAEARQARIDQGTPWYFVRCESTSDGGWDLPPQRMVVFHPSR